MTTFTQRQKVEKLVRSSVELSYDVSPTEPGLTLHEIREIGAPFEILGGELADVLRSRDQIELGDAERYLMNSTFANMVCWWMEPRPWRSIKAFDFVIAEFSELARRVGAAKAALSHDALVARARATGVDPHAVSVAVAFYTASEMLQTNGGALKMRGQSVQGLPSENLAHNQRHGAAGHPKDSDYMEKLLQVVRDVISRRGDGRGPSRDVLVSFEDEIRKADLRGYEVWWRSMAGELNLLTPSLTPTAATVMSAALAEAALSVVARGVAATGKSMTSDFITKDERAWRFIDLVKSAKRGAAPILNAELGGRCERLNDARQRIHLGRFLAEGSTPAQLDIREEEARYSRETLEHLLRAILDWSSAHLGGSR